MINTAAIPSLADLSMLGKQIELDRQASVHELRARDRAIGLECDASDDVGRLLFWLKRVPKRVHSQNGLHTGWFSGSSAVYVVRVLALVLGFMCMAGFLLSGDKGLVNVLVFILLFVLIQFGFFLVSVFVMIRTLLGGAPVVFPLNPVKLVEHGLFKAVTDRRFLRESESVVRVLLLRYGQELGALFTLAAVAAFFTLLAFNEYTFVWSSTFTISDEFVRRATTVLAMPWSSWFPAGTLPAEVITESRYNPAFTNLASADLASLRGWWPFLITSMLCYSLLPRILLWIASRHLYVKRMRRSIAQYPGSESILLRMNSPRVSTQALEPEQEDSSPDTDTEPDVLLDEGLLLLGWAGALDTVELYRFEELSRVPPGNLLTAGLGTLERDADCIDRIHSYKPAHLLVAVKAWEPPMAELQDFLNRLDQVTRCTLYLVPLPGRAVSDLHLQEWRDFSRGLRFDTVAVQALARL